MANDSFISRPFFRKIAYSTCWEDYNIIQKALKVEKNDALLSITSAGCNVLNLLLNNPRKVLSIDVNPNQNHLLELKIEAIKNLEYHEFIELLGIIPSKRRREIYNSIRRYLGKDARFFWDRNIKLIEKGITYNGRQERYIQTIGKILRFFKGKEIEKILGFESTEEQIDYFKRNIDGFIWRSFFNVIYSKPVMLMIKDRFIFNQVTNNSYHVRFRERVEKAVFNIPAKGNPFASMAIAGRYLNEDYYPPYLKKESFPLLKERVDRVDIKTVSLQNALKELPADSFTKFNLSNALDWVNIDEFKETLKELGRVGRHGSRFCYFNTLITRNIPKDLDFIKSHKKLASQLLERDRAFLYGNFEVGEIIKHREAFN
ncbi:MAG: DUF3419 family protein [Thermoplasmata archaeon]|nr:DUF3419 family protein [Thermoplasmata archaeon]